MSSLTRRFASAVQWNIAISGATVAVQLVITAIVARLLSPADFGLYAVANVAFVIATHLGGAGLISAVVRERVLDDEVIGSAVVLSLGVSAVLAIVTILLAPLAGIGADAADAHTLRGLVRIMSVAIALSGIGAPAQAMMQRDLRFRELGLTQFAALVFGLGATTMLLAALGNGPWSLAYGNIAYMAIVAVLCWWQARTRWSLAWRRGHIVRVGRVGLQMTVLRLLDAFWTQIPLVIAHSQLTSFEVGLYQRSQSLVDTGVQSTCARVSGVLFPVMAAQQDRDERLRQLIPPLIGAYALFLLSVTAFVAAASPVIVAVVLGAQWRPAATPLAIIMIAFASLFISQPASSQLEARAVFKPRTIAAAFGALAIAVGGLLLARGYGVSGIAAAAIISGAGTSGINFAGVCADLRIRPRQIVSWLVPGACVAGAVAAATRICSSLLIARLDSPILQLVVTLLVAILVALAGARFFVGRSKRLALSNFFPADSPHYLQLFMRLFGIQGRGR